MSLCAWCDLVQVIASGASCDWFKLVQMEQVGLSWLSWCDLV